MTNTEPASSKAEPFVTIPCSVIEYVRTLKLTGTQYAFWLYLLVLDPYGDRWIEVPSPSELAPVFKVDIRTLQRAAQRLDDADLFEFEVIPN
jgi:DNA-binding MarR family transcriptional regulator